MKRNIFRNMSREEVVASMANKLAEGTVLTSNKKKTHSKRIFVVVGIISGGIICLLLLFAVLGKSQNKETDTSYLKNISVAQSPHFKLKTAFNEGKIGVNEYALYLDYLLVKYDSVPGQYKTPRPFIDSKEVDVEIRKIWGRLSIRTRSRIIQDLPHLNSGAK